MAERSSFDEILFNKDFTLVHTDIIAHYVKNPPQVVSWYDNEFGYSARVIDLISYMQSQDQWFVRLLEAWT